MATGPITPLVKGLAAGIGLVSEYRHHRKEQEAAKQSLTVTERPVSDRELSGSNQTYNASIHVTTSTDCEHGEAVEVGAENDEKHWDLDEAQDEVDDRTADKAKVKTPRDPAKIAKQFTDAHPPSHEFGYQGLELPVVLPQRRPKNRTRGFIRAYAPELQNCDIDQDTFLEFIETFNTATLASPWLDAINLASFALVTLPTAISQAVSIAIAIAVDITKNMQSRHRHSYVLDQLNTDFFRPRGLYALILTWNPESSDTHVSININETVAQNLSSPQTLFEKAKHSFRPSMGNTVGTAFSETAPLVFPVLDSLVNSQTPDAKEFKQKVKSAKGLIAEYFDRRAQAEHAGENPDSQLAVTKPVFTSRYSDPNNATNSGDVLALVTGGKVSMPARGGLLGRGRGGGLLGQRRGLLSHAGGIIGQRMAMSGGDRFSGRGFSRFGYQSYNNAYDQPPEYEQDSSQMYQRGGLPMRGLSRGGSDRLITGSIKRVFQHVSFPSVCSVD